MSDTISFGETMDLLKTPPFDHINPDTFGYRDSVFKDESPIFESAVLDEMLVHTPKEDHEVVIAAFRHARNPE